MGRASRAKLERQLPADVNGVLVARTGRRFYYRGKIVGGELAPLASLATVPNPPPEPLESWELKLPWKEIGDGVFVSTERMFE